MTDGVLSDVAATDRAVTETSSSSDLANAPERRPGDIAWLVVSLIGLVLCALWSGANGDTNENLCKAINGLGDGLEGIAKAFTFLGLSQGEQ